MDGDGEVRTGGDPFEEWLNERLRSWGADEAVLGGYLCGLLADGDPPAEQREALISILQDIIEDDIDKHVSEIMEKWQKCHPVVENGASSSSVDVEDRLVKLLGSQSLTTLAPKQYTDDEKKIREAILSQYSQCSDNEEGAIESDLEGHSDKNLVRNTNAETVAAAARERREQAKQESQRKKDKDKEDREKQKQLKEEKKEKRKTQKGERKR